MGSPSHVSDSVLPLCCACTCFLLLLHFVLGARFELSQLTHPDLVSDPAHMLGVAHWQVRAIGMRF